MRDERRGSFLVKKVIAWLRPVPLAEWLVLATVLVLTGAVFMASWTGEAFSAWVEALATLAAFLAAVFAASYAAGAFRLERERDDRFQLAQEEAQRIQKEAQASLVAGWPDRTPVVWKTAGGVRKTMAYGPQWASSVALRNASNLPVTQVSFEVWVGGDQIGEAVDVGLLAPADEPRQVTLDRYLANEIEVAEDTHELTRGVAITFRDAAGVVWRREQTGKLSERSHPVLFERSATWGVEKPPEPPKVEEGTPPEPN